jgi:hypothetical protein
MEMIPGRITGAYICNVKISRQHLLCGRMVWDTIRKAFSKENIKETIFQRKLKWNRFNVHCLPGLYNEAWKFIRKPGKSRRRSPTGTEAVYIVTRRREHLLTLKTREHLRSPRPSKKEWEKLLLALMECLQSAPRTRI